MWYNFGYGVLEDELIDACRSIPPDMKRIEALLSAGADVNATASEEDNNGGVLGEIIDCYHQPESMSDDSMYEWNTLKYLPQIIDIFLKHGFDVNRKNGETGGMCLHNLWLSARDPYALDALALLLDAGANPEWKLEGEKSLTPYLLNLFSGGRKKNVSLPTCLQPWNG